LSSETKRPPFPNRRERERIEVDFAFKIKQRTR